jgi:hypothetical protein
MISESSQIEPVPPNFWRGSFAGERVVGPWRGIWMQLHKSAGSGWSVTCMGGTFFAGAVSPYRGLCW